MANRQLTVLNPGGYQEIFQSADTLVVEGVVDMSSNLIGGLPAPVSDNDAARKKYIDDAIASVNLDLQDVTDNGNTTTNAISVNSLRLPEISGTYPQGYLEFGDPGASSNNGMRMGFSNTTSNGIIEHLDTAGDLYISSGKDVIIDNIGSSEPRAKFINNGACELYHDGNIRLSTTNVAVDITGILTTTGGVSVGNTTQITESDAGSGSYNTLISNMTNGDVIIRGAELFIQDKNNANEAWAKFKADGSVELNHVASNTASTKLETTTNGVTVTGELTADSIDCGAY